MIICTNPKRTYERCIIDMDAQQYRGGFVCCDTAEYCGFCREDILAECKYARPGDVKDAALKEIYG